MKKTLILFIISFLLSVNIAKAETFDFETTALDVDPHYQSYIRVNFNNDPLTGVYSDIKINGTGNIYGIGIRTPGTGIGWTIFDQAEPLPVFLENGDWVRPPGTIDNIRVLFHKNDPITVTSIDIIDSQTKEIIISSTEVQPPVYGSEPDQPPAPPPIPVGLTATAGNGTVDLSWNAINGADFYNLYRDGSLLSSPATNSYQDDDVTNGVTYSYTVSAENENGESAQSASVIATPLSSIVIPDATTLSGTVDDGRFILTWDAVDHADDYHLYKNGSLLWNTYTTTFTDTSINEGEIYHYYVTASNEHGTSPHSNTVTLSLDPIPLLPPTSVTATGGHGSVTVKWDQVAGADGYNVYMDGIQVNSDLITAGQFVINGLDPDETYTFYVVSVAGSEVSDPSVTVSSSPTSADNSIKWPGLAAVSAFGAVKTATSFLSNVLPDWLQLGLGIIMAALLVGFIFWIVQKIRAPKDGKADKISTKGDDRRTDTDPKSKESNIKERDLKSSDPRAERVGRDRVTSTKRDRLNSIRPGRDTSRPGRPGRQGRA